MEGFFLVCGVGRGSYYNALLIVSVGNIARAAWVRPCVRAHAMMCARVCVYNKCIAQGNYVPPSSWAAWWVRALADAPHFSWLFVQDHRGGGEPPQHIRGFLRALSLAMETLNVTNWANAEFFHITNIDNPPPNYGEGNQTRTVAPIDRVHRQLLEEAPLVSGFTCWEYHWYLSPAGGVQIHRASRDDSLHSNKSLTLYRNYQRTVLVSARRQSRVWWRL